MVPQYGQIKKPGPTAMRYQFPGADHMISIRLVHKKIPDIPISVNVQEIPRTPFKFNSA
jgi:hypothetical protein